MKILQPFRPDIYGVRVEEFSAVAMGINLGNHLVEHGHELGYVTSLGPDRFRGGSQLYTVPPTMQETHMMAEAFLLYRDYGYDILHVHTANFATFKQIRRYIGRDDRVICTIHIPANIGRSFWWHKDDLLELLKFPNFRLACVSRSGSFEPLAKVFGGEPMGPVEGVEWPNGMPEGFERVQIVPNGVVDVMQSFVPWEQKVNRFMFVAHMMPSKNVKQTLLMAIEHQVPCLYVGRRLAHKKLSANEEAYASNCEEIIAANRNIITHVPFLPYQNCVQQMAMSKCLIILSEIESFGFTPIEAAMVGTPTIWLGCQGIDETMQDHVSGFRIPRLEYKTWKKRRARAAELFHAVNTLNQQQMAGHVRHRYSMGACTATYEHLYTEVINGASAASNA